MSKQRPIRVLFLHASWEKTSEYNVHKLLAENVDPALVKCYFIWQEDTKDPSKSNRADLAYEGSNIYFDFGRDMGLTPKPAKWKRALMELSHFPFAYSFLVKKIREIQPDIIYTSQQAFEVYIAKHLATMFHLPHFIHISYPVGSWLGKRSLDTILHTPNLIACSKFVEKSALEAGVRPDQIETLLHGANVEKYNIPKNREWLRREFDLPEDTAVIVTAARLDPFKGYTVLLNAMRQVVATIPQARLIACGEGTTGTGYDEHIKQLASNWELDDVAIFCNFRDDLPQIFAGADLFCLPTKMDALPLVFLGAMAAGLPVVGVRSGGVPEMVADGRSGLISEPDEPNALAENIITLLQDQKLAQQYGEVGREIAFHDFDPQKVAQDWASLLHRRLNKSR